MDAELRALERLSRTDPSATLRFARARRRVVHPLAERRRTFARKLHCLLSGKMRYVSRMGVCSYSSEWESPMRAAHVFGCIMSAAAGMRQRAYGRCGPLGMSGTHG